MKKLERLINCYTKKTALGRAVKTTSTLEGQFSSKVGGVHLRGEVNPI
tara:strand:- start:180 stop:323 length:144 start_codon:yes stop_codon:yes gene_type:complete